MSKKCFAFIQHRQYKYRISGRGTEEKQLTEQDDQGTVNTVHSGNLTERVPKEEHCIIPVQCIGRASI